MLKLEPSQDGKKNCNAQVRTNKSKTKRSGTPIHVSPQDLKGYIMIGMTGVFCLLFAAFVVYAMVSSDADILQKTFSLLWWGLIAILAWAFDKRLLRYFMESSNDENHER
jgi:hypothetical protein